MLLSVESANAVLTVPIVAPVVSSLSLFIYELILLKIKYPERNDI